MKRSQCPATRAEKWRHNLCIGVYTPRDLTLIISPHIKRIKEFNCLRGCDQRKEFENDLVSRRDAHWIYAYHPTGHYPVFLACLAQEPGTDNALGAFHMVMDIYFANVLEPQVCPYETMQYVLNHAFAYFENPRVKFYVPRREGFTKTFTLNRGYESAPANAVYSKEAGTYRMFASGQVALHTWVRFLYGNLYDLPVERSEDPDDDTFFNITE